MNLETLNQYKAHYDQFHELPVEVMNEMFTIVGTALTPPVVESELTLAPIEDVTTTSAPVKRKSKTA